MGKAITWERRLADGGREGVLFCECDGCYSVAIAEQNKRPRWSEEWGFFNHKSLMKKGKVFLTVAFWW